MTLVHGELVFQHIIKLEIAALHFKHCSVKYVHKKRSIGSRILITKCFFKGSKKSALIINGHGLNLAIINCTFSANNGVIVAQYNISLQIFNSIFQNNWSDDSGSALNIKNVVLNLTNSLFINNTASGSGGAIAANGCSLVIDGTLFHSNVALETGGSIYLIKCPIRINNCRFISNSNTAITSIELQPIQSVFLEHSTFIGNYAQDQGGAIYMIGVGVGISNCLFKNNSAKSGGASKQQNRYLHN